MREIKLILLTILLSCLLAYFVYHTIYGNRGLLADYELEKQINTSNEALNELRSKRIELEHNVKLLRPQSLDKDMLDEQARRVLGAAKKNEEVFINLENNNEYKIEANTDN